MSNRKIAGVAAPLSSFVGGTERSSEGVPAEERICYRPGVNLNIKLLPDVAGTFYLYEPCPQYGFDTNAWDVQFTAQGKVTAIGAATEPQIPREFQKAVEK